MDAKTQNLLDALTAQPVVPVLIVESVEHAVPLARALVEGGLKALEITLRTDAALDVIKAMSEEIEGAVIGAGTILSARDYAAAEKAGAKFIVSPGINGDILDAACLSPVLNPARWACRVSPDGAAQPVRGGNALEPTVPWGRVAADGAQEAPRLLRFSPPVAVMEAEQGDDDLRGSSSAGDGGDGGDRGDALDVDYE